MCGRFATTATMEEIGETFSVQSGLNISPRYNIAPSQAVPVIRHPDEAPIYKDKVYSGIGLYAVGPGPHQWLL
jgi:putative SOS response-associated peptidase YedK